MSAPARRSVQEIVNVLLKYEGNVAATADELGMRRGSLYERLERLNLDPQSFRLSSAGKVSGMSGNRVACPEVSGMVKQVEHVRKSASVLYPARRRERRLADVQTASAEVMAEDATFAGKPARLSGAQRRQLREAKFDWQARYRVEIQESGILQQFFEERFEEWIKAKLTTKAKGEK